jgi:hypothetical protein
MHDDESLTILAEEVLAEEVLRDIERSLSSNDLKTEFSVMPARGPQANIFFIATTAVAVIFGTAFVKKLGEKAAEDTWPHLKDALRTTWDNYFGNPPKIPVAQIGLNGPIPTEYSQILSLYCISKSGQRIKFLYKESWSAKECERITELYLHHLSEFVATDQGPVQNLADSWKTSLGVVAIAYDGDTGGLKRINPLPPGVHV